MYQLSHSLSRKKSQPRSQTSLSKFYSNPIENNLLTNRKRTSTVLGETLQNLQFTTHASNPFNKRRHSSSKNLFIEAKKSLSKEKSLSIQKQKSHSKFEIPSKKDALRNLDTNGTKTKHIEDILRLKMQKKDSSDYKKKKQYVEQNQLRKIIERTAAHSRKIQHTMELVVERTRTQNFSEEKLYTLQSQLAEKQPKKLTSNETVYLVIEPTKQAKDKEKNRELKSPTKRFQEDIITLNEITTEPTILFKDKNQQQKTIQRIDEEKEREQKLRQQREAQIKRQRNEEKQRLKKLEKERQQKQQQQQKARVANQKKKQKQKEVENDQKSTKPPVLGIPPKINYFAKDKQASDVDSLFSEIQHITLSPESKITLKNSPKKNSLKEQEEEKKKKKNEEEKQRQQRQRQIQRQKLILEKQEQKRKKEKEKQQIKQKNIKQEIGSQISEANRVIDMMTPVGQVAGYCSQVLKKSKLNWHTSATLLYKQCYQKFKSYEDIYNRAASEKIIEEVERDRYLEDNQIIATNLGKIIQMGKKKNKIKPEYEKILTATEPQDLSRSIHKQVLAFYEEMKGHPEGSAPQTQMCLLRMLNGVLIIASLKGINTQTTIDDIDQIQPGEVNRKIKQKLKVVEKIRFQK